MKKSTKMVEEITAKRKLPQTVKEPLKKRVWHNCFLAIGVIGYFILIELVFLYAKREIITITNKVFPMLSILVAVGLLEFAYRKENGRMAVVGIEFFMVSVMVLYMPKLYANLSPKIGMEWAILPLAFVGYYGIKLGVIYWKTKKEYENQLSDVKEIVKEEV